MSCIDWFNRVIINRDENFLREEFGQLAKNSGGYFIPHHKYPEYDDQSAFFVDIEMGGTVVMQPHSFESFLKSSVILEANKSIVCIQSDNSVEINPSILKKEIETLLFINANSDFLELKSELENGLSLILKAIQNKENERMSGNEEHRIDNRTYFGFKGKISEIKKLYETLEDINFFNPNEYQYESFSNILINPILNSSSTMVVNSSTTIKVACNNERAAYILKVLEPKFENLTYRSISQSQIILNKLGKTFNENDLSKAKHQFLSKADFDSTAKDEIDEALAKI